MPKKVTQDVKENPAMNYINVKDEPKPRKKAEPKNRLENLDKLRMYTLTELEPVIGVSHRTLLEYVKHGRIKAVKIGGKWKLSEVNLMKFLNGEEQ